MSKHITQIKSVKMKTTYPPKPWPTFNEWAKWIAEQKKTRKVKTNPKKK